MRGRDWVAGDVRDMPGSTLSFRLCNDDGRFSPLNANNPTSGIQWFWAWGAQFRCRWEFRNPVRPIPPQGPWSLPCRMCLQLPGVVRRWSSRCWDEPALHGHPLTGCEARYRPTGGTRFRVLHVNKGASWTRIVPPANATTPLTKG